MSLHLLPPFLTTLLQDAGVAIGDMDDLTTSQEKQLGALVKAKHGVDFFFMDK